MKLVRLEIRNYMSVEDLCGSKAIAFDGLDCLVGKNNVGKSNILKAIRYLLEGERLDIGHYYRRDSEREIDIRAYFKVEPQDFELLQIENKREAVRAHLLEDGTLGVCRRSGRSDLELIRNYPYDNRLRPERFDKFHKEAWLKKKDKNGFEAQMLDMYPELGTFLTEGKGSNKGEWSVAYERFLANPPDGIEFIMLPGSPPTGISADLKNMLPKVIFVPAVKEVSDATKAASSRTELGALLTELSMEVREELDAAIDHAMQGVHRRLNVYEDATGTIVDKREPGVQRIEEAISDYLSETFDEVTVNLEFPNPESKVLFQSAKVWINEKGFEKVTVENAGEGVKRVLIFSLIRTLADLRQGRLNVEGDKEASGKKEGPRQSVIVLYEEAELFLHPGLQQVLLKAFGNLAQIGDQIIFTTHSPFLLQSNLLTTINIVNKTSKKGTTDVEFHSRLNERNEREKNRLLQVQNVASYIFAEKVVLVEGESDRIVLQKVAPALDKQWDFIQNGIPVLPVTGKGDLPLYRDFLKSLGIRAFVVTDVDAIDQVVSKLCSSTEVRNLCDELIQSADRLIGQGKFSPTINRKFAKRLKTKYSWKEVFIGLEGLYSRQAEGKAATEKQMECLKKLLLFSKNNARVKALISDDRKLKKKRLRLAELLLAEDILYLKGTIEDYYPSSGNKIESALQFDPITLSKDIIRSNFCVMSDGESTDLEIFLTRVFNT